MTPVAPIANARVVAVTGATTYLGERLVAAMEADAAYRTILALDTRRPLATGPKTQYHAVDLTQPTADQEIAEILTRERADTFVHLSFLDRPSRDGAWAHELENIGTMYVLNAIAEVALPRFVMVTTTMTYGAYPSNPNFIPEHAELRGEPDARFVRDKVEAEKQVRAYRARHRQATVTVLRPCAIVGPTSRNFWSRFFLRPVVPTILGYDPLMQLVHEDDAFLALKRVVDRPVSGEFNIVGDGVLPLSTMIKLAGRVPVPMPYFAARAALQTLWSAHLTDTPGVFLKYLKYLWVADGTHAREVLGFVPRYTTREALITLVGSALGRALARQEG